MSYRITLIAVALMMATGLGCRTGEYNFDGPIYKAMPALLKADPDLSTKIAANADGSLNVTFKKGEMYLTFADGIDENTRKNLGAKAFSIFHNQYMESPTVKSKTGSFRRDKIGFHGFVGDTELYVYEWKLADAKFTVISDRFGNFM